MNNKTQRANIPFSRKKFNWYLYADIQCDLPTLSYNVKKKKKSIEIILIHGFSVWILLSTMYHHRQCAPLHPIGKVNCRFTYSHIYCEFFFVILTRSVKNEKKKCHLDKKKAFSICFFGVTLVSGLPVIDQHCCNRIYMIFFSISS